MNRLITALIATVLIAALGIGGYFLWKQRAMLRLPKSMPAQEASAPQPETPASSAQAPEEPAIRYPIAAASAPADSTALPALAASDEYFSAAIAEVVKKPDVLTFLQLDGFARRVVATVDNLARPHAAPMLWPVVPTPGRFTTTAPGPSGTPASISQSNAARYTPFVRFVESIDTARAVSLYARSYPLFQKAYEELGYPRRYFNDRLVAVIDHLLATPAASAGAAVRLTEVKGPVAATSPWLRYEFADAQLESLSAGQKMLLRAGLENQMRLKAKLRDVRQKLTGAPLAASTSATSGTPATSAPRP